MRGHSTLLTRAHILNYFSRQSLDDLLLSEDFVCLFKMLQTKQRAKFEGTMTNARYENNTEQNT